VAGSTQASTVNPVVKSSEGESLIVICELVPLKKSALPNRPAAVQVAPVIVPVFPLPEASDTVVPLPSSKPYAATGLTEVPALAVMVTTPDDAWFVPSDTVNLAEYEPADW